ncbi:LOW QUALITY PROTEIN: piezo-type mechanosensitive ion channel component 2 [Salvelinus alpinus]
MASEVVCGLIFRLLLPICLATACLFRYNGLSFVYLIYLLLIPLFAEPTSTTMQGKSPHPPSAPLPPPFSPPSPTPPPPPPPPPCSTWEKSIRQIGFESVIGADAGNGIRVFLPDIGMFLAGLACWLLCRSLFQKRPPEDMAQDNTDYEPEGEEEEEKLSPDDNVLLDEDFEAGYEAGEEEEEEMEEEEEEEEEEESNKMKILRHIAGVASKVKEIIGNLITTAGKVVVTILLGLTGITLPSLTSAVYFFVFLFLCTWWSFCRTFDTLIFSCMCVLMAIFSAGHLVVLYLYQFQFFQESIPPEDSYISLFGISSLIQTDCSSTWRMIVNPELAWHHFVNPIMLLLLYYTLATLIRLWLQEPIEVGNTLVSLIRLWLQEPIEVGNTLATLIRLWLQEPIEEPIEVGNTLVSLIRLWLQEPIEEPIEVGNTLVSLIRLWLQEPIEVGNTLATLIRLWLQEPIEEPIEVGNTLVSLIRLWLQEPIEEPIEVGNTLATLIRLWLQEPIEGLAAKSNGTSCDISTLNTVENRPVGQDLYSTPQYKMDQTNNITEEEEEEGRVNAVVTVFRFIMKQSYICALIAMMAWSITYVSWLTFVFLMWSCMLWMVRDRRRYTMLTSPFMVLYGNLLIVLQYIWSFELLEPVPGLFLKKDVPFSELGSKVLCLLSFWLLLRQTLTERKDKQREEDAVLTDVHVHYEYWRRILKYFWMSVVVYTMLVLILVYTFQFETSLPFWSNMTGTEDLGLEQFSLSMLFTRIFIPTSFLLVCILHLHYFHDRFLLLTDLKAVAKTDSTIYRLVHQDGSLADITMLSISSGEGSFESNAGSGESGHCSVGTEPDPSTENTTSDLKNKWHLVVDRLTVLFLKFLEYFHKLQLFIWWLLEIHIIKIVSSYIILVSVKEVSLFNYVFMACWAFALPFSQFRPLASSICTVWTCVIIVCKMLYQLESIQPASYSKNCSMPMNYTEKQREEMKDSLLYKEPVDPSNWVGLNKFNPLLENLRNNLLMLAMLAFEVTIYRHQQYYRLRNKLTAPAARIIFHDITRQHLDNGIVNCVKYFINYFFYKFGLETCFLLAVNVIGQRMDFYAMLHAFSLIAVMYRRRRKAIAEIWPKYCCFQACILTWQYFVCIGIPPAACKDYPWRFPNSAMDSNVIKWLYFPDFHTNPNPIFLVYDFMLLLCASLQGSIFDEENKAAVRLMAGDNVEICRDLDAASFSVHNPVPDFIHCRSYLDMLKVIMFSYLFWFVLTIIFITGTTRISLFCLGYLVGCFYFLLFGGELLLKPIKKILHYWDFLIAYNVFVITMKNILSILACGYINVLVVNNCWLIQLLSLACTIKEYKVVINRDITPADGGKKCDLPKDEAGIIWDSICFAFLLLQRRVFMSYYFLHVVADIRASQILASRGAELFQATIVKAVRARLEEENKSMEQLKRQMDRIKQRQEKFKSGKKKMLSLAQESGDRENPIQPQESGDREEKEKVKETAKTKKRQWWRPWVDHASMVRSGDYYLFETDSEEEEEEEEKREDQELPKKSAFQRAIGKFASALIALPRSIIKLPKTILQYVIRAAKFVYHAWITDSKAAMKERSKEKRKFWKRYTKRDKHKKDKKEGHVTIEMEEDQEGTQKKKSDGPDNILKRVFNIIKFTWVLFQTMVESFTKWMNNVCREHIDISTVLRIERCMLTREVKKGNVPSRESIHMFYQKQMRMSMSRGSSLDRLSEEDSASGGSHRVRRRRGDYRMESQDSMASLASRDSISSAYTEATMLFSRQDTLDELDGMPSDVHIPKTSERARPKLRKIYGLDASKSTDSSSSQVSSETTQCITLYSRQGTTDTIDEVEDEQDQGEDRQHGPWGHPPPEGAEGAEDSPWRGGGDDGGGETTEERERYQGQGDPWGSPGPGEGPSFRVEEGASNLLALQQGSRPGSQDCTTDSDDGGVQDRQEYLNRAERDRAGLLYTPDTDAPNTSDADVPPSYSKAVSFDRLEVSEDESDRDDNRMMAMTPDTSRSDYLDDPLLPSLTTELTASELLLNKMFHDEELERSERFYVGQPLVLQLVYALYNMLVAHSESVCYLVIILNNMLSASCVTLVLPILIFLWAMLSVPRPSKRFWMTAIVYTEVAIVIKYFFQFGFFPFNQNPKVDVNKPYHPPNIIGVEKKDGYVVYDLIQLLALFFHRSILKCHGLWDEDNLKDTKKEILRRDTESEDDERRETEATPVPSTPRERKGSTQTLRSINLGVGTSVDSVHVPVHYVQQQQQTYQRRKSSSGGSHISHRSVHSVRSKRGSTNSRNSSHRDGGESVQQKTKKQLIKEKLREQMIKAKTFTVKRTMEVYLPIRQFFYNLVHPEYSAVTDVYVLMFLADTIDFIIIVFGFSAFGKHSAGADITSSLSEDQVPGAFLVMVLIQFGTMVVDRALYLKKTVLGKVIFQVVLVFGIHFWMFFILPGLSERRFNENTVAKLWYCIKCIYFGLSAYQIRCGYPTRVLGNFLTKSYNYANLFLFQGFRLIPFLTELRAVMDWVWTDTSLSLSSWICVEDIYAHIFVLKCWRESERRYPQPRGQAKKPVVKYGMGGMIVMLLICIIWFPLLFMSLVKSVVGVVNKPLDVSFSITLAGFQPIFTMSAQQNQLREVSNHEFHGTFMRSYLSDPDAMQWLESYMPEDLTIAELEGSSNSLWTISPPSRTNIMKMLSSKEQFPVTLAWSIQRNQTLGAKAEFSTGKKVMFLDDKTKLELFLLLNGTRKDGVVIKHGFPRYLRAPTDSEAKPIQQLCKEEEFITLALERFHNDSAEVQEWWIVNQTSPGKINVRSPKNLYDAGLELYVFSDQVSPPSLGFLAGYGIMGLYASVVLVIGKFVREFFSGISHTIMFEELPNVDRILKLCTDIFLVRETGELDLEEDMYAKLIFLYRSPETMIKWTREKTQ